MQHLIACIVVMLGCLLAAPHCGAQETQEDVSARAQGFRAVVAFEAAAERAVAAGNLPAAANARADALRVAVKLGRPSLVGALFERLGNLELQRNHIQDAVIAFESGVLAMERDPGRKLADTVQRLGDGGKGLPARGTPVPSDLYSDAAERELPAAESDSGLTVRLLMGVGNSYLRQFQDASALNAYGLALRRPELEQLPLLRAFLLANQGEALRRQGKLDDAERALEEALSRLEREAPESEQRRALTMLAGICRDRAQGDRTRGNRAHALYARALGLYEREKDVRGEAFARSGLAFLLMQENRCDEAVPMFGRAIELAGAQRADNVVWPAWLGLGRCERKRGRLDEAAAALENSYELVRVQGSDLRTDEGKVGLLESAQDLQDEMIKLGFQRASRNPGAYTQLLALTERARGSALRELMQGWGDVRPSAASFGLMDCEDDGRARNTENRGMQQPMQGMQAQMQLGTPAQMQPGTPSQRAASPFGARADAAGRSHPDRPPLPRLVFYVLEDSTLVLSVGADGAVHGHSAPLGRQALAQRVAQLRAALGVRDSARGVRVLESTREPGAEAATPTSGDHRASSRVLYDALIAPLERHLPATGQTLVLEPHDSLWLVPFAALDVGRKWMGERWPLVYAPSAEVLNAARSHAAPDRKTLSGFIVGNPIIGPIDAGNDEMFRLGFAPLPGAADEAKKIGALFPSERSKLLLGSDGGLATVMREAQGYDVLHLASHGIARTDNPLASFVLLAPSPCGQLLTARHVMTLALKADLVVLSACQSGLGRVAGEGVLGLSRAFLFAGAASVLVSHWSVSDHATSTLMIGFYARYLGQGMDKAKALHESMSELRRQQRFEHPRYWAPFFLVGAE